MGRQAKSKTETKGAEEKKEPEGVTPTGEEETGRESAVAPQEEKSRNPAVNAPNGLNLRSGPHKSYAVLSVLESGTEVEVLPLPGGVKVPGWSLVTTPGYAGWVMDEFLRFPEEG